jgi:hypothetical protein
LSIGYPRPCLAKEFLGDQAPGRIGPLGFVQVPIDELDT